MSGSSGGGGCGDSSAEVTAHLRAFGSQLASFLPAVIYIPKASVCVCVCGGDLSTGRSELKKVREGKVTFLEISDLKRLSRCIFPKAI